MNIEQGHVVYTLTKMTIQVRTRHIAPAETTLPALGVHLTRLAESYMIWVGVTTTTAETVGDAPRSGSLCRDWACATVGGAATTALYRTSGSDVAYSMAQRLGGFDVFYTTPSCCA